jgi:type VI secretion system protein
MFERRLLERLEAPDSSDRRLKVDPSALSESVLAHLKLIFNTRQGSCETRPDLGMPDFNDLATRFPDAIPIIGRAIKYQLDNFEPRLKNVSVKHVPDPTNPLSLYFQISAQLALPDEDVRLNFDTVLGDDGYFRMRN